MTNAASRLTGDLLAQIALEAGALIMQIFDRGFEVGHKGDDSPVTEADEKAEALILARLKEYAPDLPVLAEEAAAAGDIPELGNLFACVDPLDGTREFINRRTDFTVNIAIIENGMPIRGVVYAPALKMLYVAEGTRGAWRCEAEPGMQVPEESARRPITIRLAPKEIAAVASRSHRTPETDAFLENFDIAELKSAGSSLKFCLVAAGEADLYPRMGRTMEWDTAAGHAVVQAAGGTVLTEDGAHLRYNKAERGYDNPNFIVYGDVKPITIAKRST